MLWSMRKRSNITGTHTMHTRGLHLYRLMWRKHVLEPHWRQLKKAAREGVIIISYLEGGEGGGNMDEDNCDEWALQRPVGANNETCFNITI